MRVRHEPLTERRAVRARLAGFALLLGICPESLSAETIRVGVAASLRDAVSEIARDFEAQHPEHQVQLAFGASNTLAAQVVAGAPLDVLLLAHPDLEARIRRALGVQASRTFASNRLVVVTRSAEISIETPEQLLDPAIRRIAIPETAVPVGRYAREWLDTRGIAQQVAERAVRTEHARATLVAVEHGHVDAAIVYASDARLARKAHLAYRIPAAEQPPILYRAVVPGRTPPAAAVRQWLDALLGAQSQRRLEAAGFSPPPSNPR